MKVSGIYQIQSKCKPERIYIGSSVNIKRRWAEHIRMLNKNKHHSKKLQRHYNKYNLTDLLFSVLLSCPKKDLIKTEQFFLDSYKPFFNECPVAGNCIGFKHSEESKEKMSRDRIGRKHSRESILKMSASKIGNIPWNKGKQMPPVSQETREKMSLVRKGRTSQNKGKHPSEETLQRMREAQKGPRPWLVGKKHPPVTEETKQKLRLAWAKRGYTISEETKKKMIGRVPWNKGLSSWNKGKKMSQEARDKMSASKKGKPTGRVPWNKGLKTKNRIKQAS
jgi:predicted GIY-YIG superfamily endonuclease